MVADFKSTYRGVASYLIYAKGKEPYRVEHFFLTADQYMKMYDEDQTRSVWSYTREEFKAAYADCAGGYFKSGRDPATQEEIAAVRSAL